MKNKKKSNVLKKMLYVAIIVYVIITFANLQKTLNSYKTTANYSAKQIEEKLSYQQELNETKNNINSKEYIEKVAREQLDMYLPNEKVYVAQGR